MEYIVYPCIDKSRNNYVLVRNAKYRQIFNHETWHVICMECWIAKCKGVGSSPQMLRLSLPSSPGENVAEMGNCWQCCCRHCRSICALHRPACLSLQGLTCCALEAFTVKNPLASNYTTKIGALEGHLHSRPTISFCACSVLNWLYQLHSLFVPP